MSYSDTTHWRSTTPRLSLFSNVEEPSFAHGSNTHLNKTLNKLMDKFELSVDSKSALENQRHANRLLEKYNHTLLSRTEPSVVENEDDIANALHQKLIQDTDNPDKAYRFGLLYNKLSSSNRLNKKWSILYLLSLLAEDTSPPTLTHSPLQNIDNLQPPVSRPFESSSTNTTRNIRRKIEDGNSDPPAIQLARAKSGHSTPESELIRDLIFVFQGIDGQYIQFDKQSKDFVLNGATIRKPVEDMVFKLTEVGWLYTKIRDFIQLHLQTPAIGLVAQSLCAALQHELTEYYKHIAILESQQAELTMRRLLVWMLDWIQKLRLMSILVDVCASKKGGALINVMHNYTKHGDPFFKRYLTDMLQTVSKPFYEMLERWMYEGELDDPYDEFLVACNHNEQDLWQNKYSIRVDMLPMFISKEQGNKIFSIGKSLNFIRYACHDLVEFEYKQTLDGAVDEAIDEAYKKTSKALLDLLKTKYKLMDHLKALKRYLLLGQGDFIEYLMDILGDNLNKPANTLFRHNLTGILESAVRSSNAQYDEPEILNRLDVRLLEIQKDDLGWDVFTLDYHVDAPINTVFNSVAMHQYLQIFNFLWSIKRVEYTLSASWKVWGKASREFQQLPSLVQDLQFAQLTIQRMIHFIYQLQHYVLFEVLECSWDKLETCIEHKCVDLDSIIDAHSNYLLEICEKGFLSQEGLSSKLQDIFDCILKYKVILDRLHSYATANVSKLIYGGTANQDILNHIRETLQETENEFSLQVLQFLDILKTYRDEDLRSLSTRLDYNDYYSSFE